MLLTRILIFSFIAAFTPSTKEKEELIFTDNFEKDLSSWAIEQFEGGTAAIINGQLEVDDKNGCTIWFRNKLSGDIKIEYDVTLIENNGPNDRVSDLNCFWKATDPNATSNLLQNSKNRNGKFANYHSFKLYYVGFGANNNTTTRFRRYPGDGTRPMLPEHDLSNPEYMNIANQKRHVQILCKGNKTTFTIDGQIVFNYSDDNPLEEGWFGFRTVKNHMIIDNFKVFQLTCNN